MLAQRMVDKLTRRSEQITAFPLSGRMVPEYEAEDIREIIEKPYRIIYRIKAEQIDVLAVIHSTQCITVKTMGSLLVRRPFMFLNR